MANGRHSCKGAEVAAEVIANGKCGAGTYHQAVLGLLEVPGLLAALAAERLLLLLHVRQLPAELVQLQHDMERQGFE